MKDMAIDIALIPAPEILTRIIDINHQLEGADEQIPLTKTTCIPHITLLMGSINRADLTLAQQKIREIGQDYQTLVVTPTGYAEKKDPKTNRTTTSLMIEKDEIIMGLHEKLIEQLGEILFYDCDPGYFFQPENVDERTMDYLRDFMENSARSRFQPHITIGYGKLPKGMDFPEKIPVSEIAVCQLGQHSTCREMQASARLR